MGDIAIAGIIFIGLLFFGVWAYSNKESAKLKSLMDRRGKMNICRDVDDRIAIKLFEAKGNKWQKATVQQREDVRDMVKIAIDEMRQLNHEWEMGKLWADAKNSA